MRVPIGPYLPHFLRSGVGAIEITRKPAINSSSNLFYRWVCLAPTTCNCNTRSRQHIRCQHWMPDDTMSHAAMASVPHSCQAAHNNYTCLGGIIKCNARLPTPYNTTPIALPAALTWFLCRCSIAFATSAAVSRMAA